VDGSQLSDDNGEARFCYIGQTPGPDTIRAGPVVRLASASKTWVAEPLPQLELGETVNLAEDKGVVLVRIPDGGGFVPIERVSQVPVGSVIDATEGRIQLSVRNENAGRHTTAFFGSRFSVDQYRHTGITAIKLINPPLRCHRARRVGPRHRARRLFALGKHTRTSGDNGFGTVGGVRTRWLTQDRCDGTFFKVTKGERAMKGVLLVRDFRRHRSIVLHAGEHYLAKAPHG
jgi:hypothetical protein